ncbi:MAG: IS200/IS605 family transposase, partial [Acidobacteriota bacterium]
MPRNVYSEINLHITWHTKQNVPVIRNRIEDRLHHYLRSRVSKTQGTLLHEVGGVEDHIHLAVSVPPTLCVSSWIGELKGSSSHHINHQVARRRILAWQAGYGVVSFGTKDLPYVVEYIRTQKERHAKG